MSNAARLQLAVMALTLAAAPAPQLLAVDWPQILGPGRNGIYTGPPIVSSFPRTGPPLVWKRDIGAGFAGPAVGRGHRQDDLDLRLSHQLARRLRI